MSLTAGQEPGCSVCYAETFGCLFIIPRPQELCCNHQLHPGAAGGLRATKLLQKSAKAPQQLSDSRSGFAAPPCPCWLSAAPALAEELKHPVESASAAKHPRTRCVCEGARQRQRPSLGKCKTEAETLLWAGSDPEQGLLLSCRPRRAGGNWLSAFMPSSSPAVIPLPHPGRLGQGDFSAPV